MGMFTTIIHPEDGRKLQIHCGGDFCDTFKVGDPVPWRLSTIPGHGDMLDGVYASYRYDTGVEEVDAWVVIRDHRVAEVLPHDTSPEEIDRLRETTPGWSWDWWTPEAWRQYRIRKAKSDAEEAQRWADWLASRTTVPQCPMEEAGEAIAYSIASTMEQESFSRRIFGITTEQPVLQYGGKKTKTEAQQKLITAISALMKRTGRNTEAIGGQPRKAPSSDPHTDLPSRVADLVDKVRFIVEATEFEWDALRERHRCTISWLDSSCDFSKIIGEVNGRPVVVYLSFAKLNGVPVMRYDPISELVDWEMVRKWVTSITTHHITGPVRQCNAENFAQCLSFVQQHSGDE